MTKEIQSLTFKGHCQNPGPKSVSPASDISGLEGQSIMKLNEALVVISSDQFILYVGDWGWGEGRLDWRDWKRSLAQGWFVSSCKWQGSRMFIATCGPTTLSFYTQHTSDIIWAMNLLTLGSELFSCQRRALGLYQCTENCMISQDCSEN